MKEKTIPTDNRACCAQQECIVTADDLPLCCPSPKYRLWDAHPRVYMPIEVTGRETCPYCGAVYVLKTTANHE